MAAGAATTSSLDTTGEDKKNNMEDGWGGLIDGVCMYDCMYSNP